MNVGNIITNRLQLHGAYKRLFETEDGKIVLLHLMKAGFVTSTTFVGGDPQQTALNEGSRRIVLSIMRYAKKTPQQVLEDIEQVLQ